jgi:hypothetical protein
VLHETESGNNTEYAQQVWRPTGAPGSHFGHIPYSLEKRSLDKFILTYDEGLVIDEFSPGK